MSNWRFDILLEHVTPVRVVWLGLALLALFFLVLLRTRWGQSKLLRKCAVLSLLCHLLMAIFFTTVPVLESVVEQPEDRIEITRMSAADPFSEEGAQPAEEVKPWDRFAAADDAAVPDAPSLLQRAQEIEREQPAEPDAPTRDAEPASDVVAANFSVEQPTVGEASVDAPTQLRPDESNGAAAPANLQTLPEAPLARRQPAASFSPSPELTLSRRQPPPSASEPDRELERETATPDPADTALLRAPISTPRVRSATTGVPAPEAK
ncbi:MAG: hypothetical protein N2C14_20950, partial [Planctomycetales bacterium]